jgi:hypothetical protein
LLVSGALLTEPSLLALGDERLVAASIGRGGAGLEMEDVVYDVCKKSAVVTDQQNRLVGILQVILEPSRGLEVEVIRRLVEQKDVSRAHQLSCQAESPAFAAAQLLQWLCTRFFGIKPKTLKHSVDPRGKRVASLAIESFEIAVVLRQHLR